MSYPELEFIHQLTGNIVEDSEKIGKTDWHVAYDSSMRWDFRSNENDLAAWALEPGKGYKAQDALLYLASSNNRDTQSALGFANFSVEIGLLNFITLIVFIAVTVSHTPLISALVIAVGVILSGIGIYVFRGRLAVSRADRGLSWIMWNHVMQKWDMDDGVDECIANEFDDNRSPRDFQNMDMPKIVPTEQPRYDTALYHLIEDYESNHGIEIIKACGWEHGSHRPLLAIRVFGTEYVKWCLANGRIDEVIYPLPSSWHPKMEPRYLRGKRST